MNDTQSTQDGFVNKAIAAIPGWALGTLGVFIGVVMTMQVAGYNNAAVKIIDATARRYEASAASIETSAKNLEAITARINTIESRVTALEIRADKTDLKYHTK